MTKGRSGRKKAEGRTCGDRRVPLEATLCDGVKTL